MTQADIPHPIVPKEGIAPIVAILDVFGQAAGRAAEEFGIWLRFVTYSIVLNILFMTILVVLLRLNIWHLVILIFTTLLFSLLSYCLLQPLLEWLFGDYHSVTFTLLVTTFFVTRSVTKEQINH
jgi:hypothetical protein